MTPWSRANQQKVFKFQFLYYSYQYSMYIASIVGKLNFNFRSSGWICKCASRYKLIHGTTALQNHQKLFIAAAASQPLGMPDLLAPSCLVKTWMSPLSIFSWIASWGMWRSKASTFPSIKHNVKAQPHTTDVVVLETQVERPTYKRSQQCCLQNLLEYFMMAIAFFPGSEDTHSHYTHASYIFLHIISSCHSALVYQCITWKCFLWHCISRLDLERAHPDVDTCTKLEGSHRANRKQMTASLPRCPNRLHFSRFLASSSTPKTIHSHKKLRFFQDFSPGSGWGTDSIPQWQTLNGRSHRPWWRNRTNASRLCTKRFPAHEDLVHQSCLTRDNTAVQ